MFDVLSLASDLLGVGGALFALLAWLAARRTRQELAAERARQEEPIAVLLRVEGPTGETVRLPVTLRRKELTRAELLGRIGMLPMREPGRRFALRALADPAFLDQLAEVQANHRREIVIPASQDEIAQFAL